MSRLHRGVPGLLDLFPMIKLPVTEQAAGGAERGRRILVRLCCTAEPPNSGPQSEAALGHIVAIPLICQYGR